MPAVSFHPWKAMYDRPLLTRLVVFRHVQDKAATRCKIGGLRLARLRTNEWCRLWQTKVAGFGGGVCFAAWCDGVFSRQRRGLPLRGKLRARHQRGAHQNRSCAGNEAFAKTLRDKTPCNTPDVAGCVHVRSSHSLLSYLCGLPVGVYSLPRCHAVQRCR